MKGCSGFSGFVLGLALILLIPGYARAYMTLFNDTGKWAYGTFANPEDGKITYRACRNSEDRNQDEKSEGSLAMICVTASYDDNAAKLGVWHAGRIGEPGGEVPCVIMLDGEEPIYRMCKIIPSRFGKGQLVLSDDKVEIKRFLAGKKLSVKFGGNAWGDASGSLDFDLDAEGLRKAAKELYNFF